MAENTGVIVLGMHRSGTSALTRAISLLGFDLGNELLPPQADNPKGFFENHEVYAFNQVALQRFGVRWDNLVFSGPGDARYWAGSDLVDDAWKIYQDNFARSQRWVLKDPRMCVLMPLWRQALTRDKELSLKYVLALRNPAETVSSLMRRGEAVPKLYRYTKDRTAGYLFWLLYTHAAMTNLDPAATIVTDFDRLMAAPGKEVRRIAGFLGVDPADHEPALTVFEREFLDGGLRKTEPRSTLEADCADLPWVIDLYDRLTACMDDPARWPEAEAAGAAVSLVRRYLETVHRREYGPLARHVAALTGKLKALMVVRDT